MANHEQYDLAESSQHCVEQGTEQFKISFHDAMRILRCLEGTSDTTRYLEHIEEATWPTTSKEDKSCAV